jgi:signal transduction histidine kinase
MHSDLVEIYSYLVDTLRDVLPCSGIAILIPTEGGATVVAQHGAPPLPHQLTLSASEHDLLDELAREGCPSLRSLAEGEPPLPVPTAGAAWLGAPIVVAGRLHGCLSMAGQFESGAEVHVARIAQQAAVALAWAERAQRAEHKAAQAQRLLEIERRLRQSNDHAAALGMVLDEALAATGATHACLIVGRQGRAVVFGRSGYSKEEATLLQQIPPSLERGLTGRAYQTGAPMRSDDVASDPTALPVLPSSRAQMVIPILRAEQVLGLIDLQAPRPYAFANVDVDWLLDLGGLAASVIERMQPASNLPDEAAPHHDLMLSSRLAVVTDLAAGVAHEINNPLTTILGYTHLLLRDQSLPQATRDDINQIMVEGRRIAALVERFLRFAQPTSSGKRPLAIDEPLREALSLLRSRFQESGVDLEVDIPPDPPMIVGQAGQLEQAFLDLLHNAVEAMHTSDVRRIKIRVSEQGGQARVAISDSGHGIRPDLLSRVFEPGFTTKVDKGISRGLGLGLYATHTIIEDHWGMIEVHSQLRRGSTFTVCLPVI